MWPLLIGLLLIIGILFALYISGGARGRIPIFPIGGARTLQGSTPLRSFGQGRVKAHSPLSRIDSPMPSGC